MAFVTRNEGCKVGVNIIDDQHKKLFEAVNQLYDAMHAGHGREKLGEILAFLGRYTHEHFRTEEELMRKTAYPASADGKAIHDVLLHKVQDLAAKHAAGSQLLSLEVLRFLKDWLAHHISEEDRRLAEHILKTMGSMGVHAH